MLMLMKIPRWLQAPSPPLGFLASKLVSPKQAGDPPASLLLPLTRGLGAHC